MSTDRLDLFFNFILIFFFFTPIQIIFMNQKEGYSGIREKKRLKREVGLEWCQLDHSVSITLKDNL